MLERLRTVLRRVVSHPTLVPFYADRVLSQLRAQYEFNADSSVSLLSQIYQPEQVKIGDDTKIKPFTVFKPKPPDGITIGEHSTLHDFGFLAGSITIGDGVRIANKVSMHSFDHGKELDSPIHQQELELGEIHIHDDVWIGAGVTVLKDVTIGEGAVVAAGTVVTEDVEPYTIVGGVPAEKIGERK